jgi:hypothetical protein
MLPSSLGVEFLFVQSNDAGVIHAAVHEFKNFGASESLLLMSG